MYLYNLYIFCLDTLFGIYLHTVLYLKPFNNDPSNKEAPVYHGTRNVSR